MGRIKRPVALMSRLTGRAVVHFAATCINAFNFITAEVAGLTRAIVGIKSNLGPRFFPLGPEPSDDTRGINNTARAVRALRNSDNLFCQFH